jgi:hypothetical protein
MIKYAGRYAESDIPSTSEEWELYGTSGGHAARDLTAALKQALKTFEQVAPKEGPREASKAAYYAWEGTAEKYADFGAMDPEPHWHARDAIRRFGAVCGYDMRELDWW